MIVRVMGEGQFRLGDDAVGRLNELDERAQDDLSPSDAIVPPSDMTLEETKRFFSEQGLIPDVSP